LGVAKVAQPPVYLKYPKFKYFILHFIYLPRHTSLQLKVEFYSSFSYVFSATTQRTELKPNRAERKGLLVLAITAPQPWWTRPNNERLRQALPIDSHAKIGVSPEPSSPSGESN
jgi:hypothetical protein